MKTIVAPDAGVLSMGMASRAERLGRNALQAKLLQTSLWKPVRLPLIPKAAAIARAVIAPSIRAVPRAAAGVRQVARRPVSSASKPITSLGRVTKATGRTASALSSPSSGGATTTRSSVALQRTVAQTRSVVGPVTPGGSGRMPALPVVARELTQHGASRGAAKLPASAGAARARLVAPVSQAQHKSRPASALAAQTGRGGERRSASASGRPSSRSQALNSARGAFGAGAWADTGSDGGVIVLSGDVVIDGRRMGEMAVNSAARSGSSAQTGARSPNFRSTALPSGLSAPLP